jgi:cathepsin A (carboxypeptidase C)
LELFLNRFPKYAKLPFHLAAESYGGTYAPNIANIIYSKNKELSFAPVPSLTTINLASVILANGLTDAYTQMGSVADYACNGPYPVYAVSLSFPSFLFLFNVSLGPRRP